MIVWRQRLIFLVLKPDCIYICLVLFEIRVRNIWSVSFFDDTILRHLDLLIRFIHRFSISNIFSEYRDLFFRYSRDLNFFDMRIFFSFFFISNIYLQCFRDNLSSEITILKNSVDIIFHLIRRRRTFVHLRRFETIVRRFVAIENTFDTRRIFITIFSSTSFRDDKYYHNLFHNNDRIRTKILYLTSIAILGSIAFKLPVESRKEELNYISHPKEESRRHLVYDDDAIDRHFIRFCRLTNLRIISTLRRESQNR